MNEILQKSINQRGKSSKRSFQLQHREVTSQKILVSFKCHKTALNQGLKCYNFKIKLLTSVTFLLHEWSTEK